MDDSSRHARWSLATRVVHHPEPNVPSSPVTTPLYQTTTFRAPDAAACAQAAAEVNPPAFYTRWGNPTIEVCERVIADLEGGETCLLFASGMAAVSSVLFGLVKSGDRVLAGSSLYTATAKLLLQDLPEFGVHADLVDPTDTEAFARAIRPETRLIYLETPSNPTMQLIDLAAVCRIARQRGIRTAVDNTFASPYNQRPLALGADIVLHSATKYLAGHSDVIAGCAVTSEEIAKKLWYKRTVMGGSLDPFAAWLLLRGIKTLALRMEKQNANAMAIARALEKHPAVRRVFYPGLAAHPQHELAARQMTGFGGMVSFDVVGARQGGTRLVESTELAILAVSLGSVETLIEHPASMSHAMLSDQELEQAGIPPGLIRLSVGIEDAGDLIADLQAALDKLC